MIFFDEIKQQFRTVIEWKDTGSDRLSHQWTDNGDEIKNASKLIVSPGQGCIFIYQGQIKAIITQACMVNLQTDNLPFLTTLRKFMQFFESEHKVGLYFFKTCKILNQKWGTTSAIKYEDPQYKFPVSLRAFGNFSYRITHPHDFFTHIIGTQTQFLTDEFRQIISTRMIHPISDFLAESRFTYADIDANRNEITIGLKNKLSPLFSKLGIELTDFRIEGTNFDEATLKRINRIADLTAEAYAAKAIGLDIAYLQQLEAMREAATNEGGAAGIGMGFGVSAGLGQTMAQAFHPPENSMSKLETLKKMIAAKLITQEEYTAKKQKILDEL